MSVRPRRSMSLPSRRSGDPTTERTTEVPRKEHPPVIRPIVKETIPKPIRKEHPNPRETTETREVPKCPLPARVVSVRPPAYTPFRPSNMTFEFGRSPVKLLLTPAKRSSLTFDEFKERHLGVKRPATQIECVSLESDGEEEEKVVTNDRVSKRHRVEGIHAPELPLSGVKGEVCSAGGATPPVTNLEVRPSSATHMKPAPQRHALGMIVKLAATPSSQEPTSISSPEMYNKIRNWLILYVEVHMDTLSESYWTKCNQALKEDLGIPVHKEFLHVMWEQICQALAVAEAKRMRQTATMNTGRVASQRSNPPRPKHEPQIINLIEDDSPLIDLSEDKARYLKRKASIGTDKVDEPLRKSKLPRSSPEQIQSGKDEEEEDMRAKLFLNLLSSAGSSPTPCEDRRPAQNRAPYPSPKAIHKRLTNLFSRTDYPSFTMGNGRELTLEQAYWLISYEMQHSPPEAERKPNGYWKTAADLFNGRFSTNKDRKSITEITARLMRNLEKARSEPEEDEEDRGRQRYYR